MNQKKALITGINGQDGFYLADLLLSKNYRVFGITRNNTLTSDKIDYISADLTDAVSIKTAVDYAQPDEIYNLASQSHAHKSWHQSVETAEINAIGAHRLFDIAFNINPHCKIFQASSSQMLGDTNQSYQNEESGFNPNNPYAIAKLYAHNIAKTYRHSYHRFISCGILYNHESPKRGMHFITQKVAYAAACLKSGITQSTILNEQGEPIVNDGKLLLGNLNAIRDWGHAADFVKAMWLMLQHETPEDFIIATGINHSIRDLCETAFSHVDLDWQKYIEIDSRFIRAQELTATADIKKIKTTLGWSPQVTFHQLISSMVDFHLNACKVEKKLC
jgi:GDPmannose 4,6-dehydratase